jgi:hypothetical protein
MRSVLVIRESFMARLVGVLALILMLGVPPAVQAAGPVEYTWTLAALGQGGWIGGPLFEDGTVGGGGALSINNGRVLAQFIPTTWTEDANEEITICFDVVVRKGPADVLPSELCVSGEATGTPVHTLIFGSDHILRITENHHR